MNTTSICVINGAQIQVSSDEAQLVPIKPICQALGVNFESQYSKLKEDDFLSSTIVLSTIVASDGKVREMVCIPLKFIYGWLFTINPKNVSEEARESVLRYRCECYNALYDHFHMQAKRIAEQNKQEIALLEEIASLTQESQAIKQQLADMKRMLAQLREDRISPQPSLF